MKLYQALTLSVLIGSLALAQQEMQAGQQYPGGTVLKNSYFGVQFSVPRGWFAQFAEEEGVQALGLGHPNGYSAVLIFQHGLDVAAYRKSISQPFSLGDISLHPIAQATSLGPLVTVYAQEPTHRGQAQIGALVGQNGSSVLILVAGASGAADFIAQGFQQMHSSLRFFAPLATQGAASLRQTWQSRIAGRVLLSSSTSTSGSQNGFGSTSSESRLLLCRNGQYQFEGRSVASVSAGDLGTSSSNSSSSAGTWKLEFVNQDGAILALTENGQQRRVNLRLVGNTLLLDGRPVSVGSSGC